MFLKAALATPHGPALAVAVRDGDAPEWVLGLEMARPRLGATNSQRFSQSPETERKMVFR
jgi:hypothetical protein